MQLGAPTSQSGSQPELAASCEHRPVWLTRTNLWRDRTSLRMGSKRL